MIKEKIQKLNEEGDLHLQFIEDAGNTYNRLLNRAMGLGSAPSVIACVGKDDETLEQRIGYYGEKLVLFAQTLGLNTCWAGTFNKKNINASVESGERKSKDPSQVSEAVGNRPEWFEEGVRMALLAPTAINQQRFLIRLNEDENVAFVDRGGPFSRVDLGIVDSTWTHFGCEPREWGKIEYLQIELTAENRDAVITSLKRIHVPGIISDNAATVYGYRQDVDYI